MDVVRALTTNVLAEHQAQSTCGASILSLFRSMILKRNRTSEVLHVQEVAVVDEVAVEDSSN
jgi:hypothetical protein